MNVAWRIPDIQRRIAHRAPFLWVDQVSWLEPRLLARGSRTLSHDEPVFVGHFPGNPIFPGVLILEALGQLGALLFAEACPEGETPPAEGRVLARIDRARFLKPVRPGVVLELEVKVLKEFEGFVKAEGIASVQGERVAQAELNFTV